MFDNAREVKATLDRNVLSDLILKEQEDPCDDHCALCRRTDRVKPFKGGYVCEQCVAVLKGLYPDDI